MKRTAALFSATKSRGGKEAEPCEMITHHLFVLLQQRAGQVQLRAGVHWDQGEAGRGGAHKLDHSGLHGRIGIGQTGLVPHRHFQDLDVTKTHNSFFVFFILVPDAQPRAIATERIPPVLRGPGTSPGPSADCSCEPRGWSGGGSRRTRPRLSCCRRTWRAPAPRVAALPPTASL